MPTSTERTAERNPGAENSSCIVPLARMTRSSKTIVTPSGSESLAFVFRRETCSASTRTETKDAGRGKLRSSPRQLTFFRVTRNGLPYKIVYSSDSEGDEETCKRDR